MVAAAYSLMEYGASTSNTDFVLTPTAVAHTYCKYHDNCEEDESVIKMLEFLEKRITKLMHKDQLSRAEKESLMVALKGMGNMGVINEEFQEVLFHIIEDSQFPAWKRLRSTVASTARRRRSTSWTSTRTSP